MPNITLAATRKITAAVVTSVVEVAVGYEHMVVRRSDNTTWAWGDGQQGGLGINATTRTVCTPTLVVGTRTFCEITAGFYASGGVQTSDKLGFTWGYGIFGFGGRGTTTDVSSPTGLSGGFSYSKILATANAQYFMAGISSAGGTAYAWGNNQFGQLGDNTAVSKNTPVAVCFNYGYKDIAVGCGHVIAIRATDDRVYGWGNNTFGRLGIGVVVPASVSVPNLACTAGDANELYSRVSCGDFHSLALGLTGNVYAWGLNTSGQLGNNTTTSQRSPICIQGPTGASFCRIAGGLAHTLALTTGGTAYAWGSNGQGQLGVGNLSLSILSPISVCTTLQFCEIAAGEFNSAAITYSGDVYTWGWNRYGQLGNGVLSQCWTPALIPNFSGFRIAGGIDSLGAITSGGTAFSWGLGLSGAIGNSTEASPGFYDIPTQACGITGLTGMTRGDRYAITWTSGGTAYAWGDATFGRLGNGSTAPNVSTPVAVCGAGLSFIKISAKSRHTLALTHGGTGYAWGNNQFGQLGTLGTVCYSQPTIFHSSGNFSYCDISAGFDHSLAVRDDGGGTGGTGYSWGNNANGQLGDNNTLSKQTPAVILARKFCRVAAGNSFSLGITEGSTMVAWGFNTSGQLGDNSITRRCTPVLVCGLTGLSFCDLSAGSTHALALTSGGTVWSWGSNTFGELGDNTIVGKSTAVAVCHAGVSFVSISAGNNVSMAVNATGGVYIWGNGTWGSLGVSGSGPRTCPTSVNI